MARKAEDAAWLEGRNHAVRVVLTDEEHALLKAATGLSDKRSMSRFAIAAIVEVAQRQIDQSDLGRRGKK